MNTISTELSILFALMFLCPVQLGRGFAEQPMLLVTTSGDFIKLQQVLCPDLVIECQVLVRQYIMIPAEGRSRAGFPQTDV
jgi:hypothetical protein